MIAYRKEKTQRTFNVLSSNTRLQVANLEAFLVRLATSLQRNVLLCSRKETRKYLFIKIQCSFEVFEARVDHATIIVVT